MVPEYKIFQIFITFLKYGFDFLTKFLDISSVYSFLRFL